MKKLAILACAALLGTAACGKKIETVSPDGRLKIEINAGEKLEFSISLDGKLLVEPSEIDMIFEEGKFSDRLDVSSITKNNVRGTITPLYGKNATLSDDYNETVIEFSGGDALKVRAYDEGAAYRFVTAREDSLTVIKEIAGFKLAADPRVYYPQTDIYTSWEVLYNDYASVSAIPDGQMAITPVLCTRGDGVSVAIAESDLRSYPGMYVVKGDGALNAHFAPYPDSLALGSWGNTIWVVKETRDYIARTEGTREFPWRAVIVAENDKDLLTNELVYKLAAPSEMTGTDWIKPGKAAWEWWHDALLPGTGIPDGGKNRSDRMFEHYIDFAAEYGLEYLLMDAGWSESFDLSKIRHDLDIPGLIEYARSKNVGIFLWCTAAALTEETADRFMEIMSGWGAVGLKVDFFDRDDQLAIEWYEYVAKTAAEHRLMIDFHGCSKPAGLQRTYPNVLTFEALRGAECAKWDYSTNPRQQLTYPFTRMLCGPVDYTPGSMHNASIHTFRPIPHGIPNTMGTRSHELAMYVVFDQYFAMLCDTPPEYRKYPDVMKFLSKVPVTFDRTIPLEAKVGEYILMAKRHGEDWYVGGMTDWQARKMTVDFSFLEPGAKYEADVYRDMKESYYHAHAYKHETMTVDSCTKLDFQLSSGGGVAIMLAKQ